MFGPISQESETGRAALTMLGAQNDGPWRYAFGFDKLNCTLLLTNGLLLAYDTAEFLNNSAHDPGSTDPGLTHIE